MAKLGDTRFILLLCFIACALILWISGKISNYIEHKIEKRSNDRFDTLVRTKLQSIEFFERDSISKIKKLEKESIKRIETKKHFCQHYKILSKAKTLNYTTYTWNMCLK